MPALKPATIGQKLLTDCGQNRPLTTVIGIAIKAAWGLTKVLVTIVFLPIILIVMAVSGFMTLAVIALIIGGIIALITSALV